MLVAVVVVLVGLALDLVGAHSAVVRALFLALSLAALGFTANRARGRRADAAAARADDTLGA